jgi:hypothetical protein
MTINRFKRHSINLDDQSHTQCGIMAEHLALSKSGLIRVLIRKAFEDGLETQDNSWSCPAT